MTKENLHEILRQTWNREISADEALELLEDTISEVTESTDKVEILTARLKRSIEIQDEMCTGCRCYHCDDLRMELATLNPTNR
jgi:20S proteasome alpha/beta subunit